MRKTIEDLIKKAGEAHSAEKSMLFSTSALKCAEAAAIISKMPKEDMGEDK